MFQKRQTMSEPEAHRPGNRTKTGVLALSISQRSYGKVAVGSPCISSAHALRVLAAIILALIPGRLAAQAPLPTVPAGYQIRVVASGGTLTASGGSLDGVVADPVSGNLYVAVVPYPATTVVYPFPSFNLYRITPAGAVSLVGTYPYGHYEVVKMAWGPDGKIYTANIYDSRIYAIDPSTGASAIFGPTPGFGRYGINFDGSGNLIFSPESDLSFYKVAASGYTLLGTTNPSPPNGNHGDSFGIQPNGNYVVYSDNCGSPMNNYAVNTAGHVTGANYPLAWVGTTDLHSIYDSVPGGLCGYSNGAIDPVTGDVYSITANFGLGISSIGFTPASGGASTPFVSGAGDGSTAHGSQHGIVDLAVGRSTTGSGRSLFFVDRYRSTVYEVFTAYATTLTLATPNPASIPSGAAGPVTLSATLTRNDTSAAVVGGTVSFSIDGGASVGTAQTDASGVATLSYNPSALIAGPHSVQASFSQQTIGGVIYAANASGTQTLTVLANQTITVTTHAPSTAVYNTSFMVAATASSGLPVSITTTGVCSGSGTGSATITMTGGNGSCTVYYNQAGNGTYSAAPQVTESTTAQPANQATLTVTGPASVTYGSAGTAAATGGSGTGALSFSASGGGCSVIGTTVSVNNASLPCSLTATQAGDSYFNQATSAPFAVTLVKANQATLTVTGPGSLTYGSTGAATTTGGSGTGALSFSASGGGCAVIATTVSVSNASLPCSLTATQAGDNNYNDATSAPFAVILVKATPVISWSNPADITYGTALDVTQLNATADVAGNFVYTPAAATKLTAGPNQALKADFTPTDTTNYSTGSKTVYINVLQATPAITVSGGTFPWDGSPHGATASATGIGGAALSPVSITYNGSSTVPLEPGTYAVVATYSGDTNYKSATANNTIIINKVTPVITWATPADLLHGYGLSNTQLNASTPVAGSFQYTPGLNVVLGIGTFTLNTTFTPADAAHYNSAPASVLLKVYNAVPTLTAVAAAVSVNEGSPAANTGTFNDLNPTDNVVFSASAGIVTKTGTNSGSWSWSYTPSDNTPAPISVTITANDQNGGIRTVTFPLTVLNVAPAVSLTGPAAGSVYPVGTAVTFTGAFTDPGALDTHTAQWSFDALTAPGTVTESGGNGSVNATYTFTTPGVYLVSLAVNDKDGGGGQANTIGGLKAIVVIYDPNGGFVTGGGWINSPAGAYAADPSLAGKANFGFVSKYQKGATVPTGETEFQFQVANFSFHSASYDWLVISGPMAQYKGSGTINGSGDYRFLLTGVDGDVNGGGGVDKFRIKVWDKTTSAVIYDNQMGQADGSGASTALGGGSIVIHSK